MRGGGHVACWLPHLASRLHCKMDWGARRPSGITSAISSRPSRRLRPVCGALRAIRRSQTSWAPRCQLSTRFSLRSQNGGHPLGSARRFPLRARSRDRTRCPRLVRQNRRYGLPAVRAGTTRDRREVPLPHVQRDCRHRPHHQVASETRLRESNSPRSRAPQRRHGVRPLSGGERNTATTFGPLISRCRIKRQ